MIDILCQSTFYSTLFYSVTVDKLIKCFFYITFILSNRALEIFFIVNAVWRKHVWRCSSILTVLVLNIDLGHLEVLVLVLIFASWRYWVLALAICWYWYWVLTSAVWQYWYWYCKNRYCWCLMGVFLKKIPFIHIDSIVRTIAKKLLKWPRQRYYTWNFRHDFYNFVTRIFI